MAESFQNAAKMISSSSDSCDVSEIFFTNLLLLGFEPAPMEKKYRIPFNKDMFSLPNKKGFEAVARFLFSRLDEDRCQEEFRDCWNVRDKKEEQMFRKVCNNWLGQIAKDDTNSYLPRIVSSLFMSPGGDKFIQFMLCFSRYVLQRVMIQENGAKSIKDYLGHPVLTAQNSAMAPAVVSGLMAGSIRQRQRFLQTVQDSVYIQEEWNNFAHEQIKDYRSKIKKMRDLERQINEERQKMADRASANHSALQQKRKSGVGDYDFDIQAVKRAQIIQQVRGMWKVFEDLHDAQSFDREIIDSILQGSLEKYKIDASELNIKIPDMLLRKCEQELQRRNVENIYHGGKVNLLSLIHLWNLSLHLYAEKLHEVGVPRLDAVVPSATTMVQTHRAHCANSEALRQKLEQSFLPDVKQSIDHLKKELDKEHVSSPNSLRITALGLGLMPPTPPVSFEPNDSLPSRGSEAITTDPRLRHNQITTPDAAAQLMRDISDKVQSRHSGLVQGTPVYAPSDRIRALDKERSQSNVAATNGMESGFRGLTSHGNTKSSTVAEPSAQKLSRFPASHVKGDPSQRSQTATHVLLSQATIPKSRDSRISIKQQSKPVASNVRPTACKKSSSHARPIVAKVDRHHGVIASSTQASRNHLDTLASKVRHNRKIADAVGSISPDREIASRKNSFEDVPVDDVAFMSRDRLEHTPPSARARSWHDTLLHDSIGPLSSTHIESPIGRALNRDSINQVAVKLFSAGLSDGDDEIGLTTDQTTPRVNSLELQLRSDAGSSLLGANTPSTICSDSPVNVEPEEDVGQRPRRDEGQAFGDEGRLQSLKEGVDGERRGGDKQGLEDGEREEEEEEEEYAEEVEDEEEEMEEDEEATDRVQTIQRSSGGPVRQGLSSSMAGQGEPSNDNWQKQNTSTRRGQGHGDTSVGQGHSKDADLELGEDDVIITHLNETLQFLRDTRTPCLPNRLRRKTDRPQDADSFDGSRFQGTNLLHVDEDAKSQSVTASEPGLRLHDDESSFRVGSSLPLDSEFVSGQRVVDVAKIRKSKASGGKIASDTSAGGLNNGEKSTNEMNFIKVLLDRDQADVIASEREVLPKEHSSLLLRSGLGDNSLNTSLKQKQELMNQSANSSNVSRNSDIDSLISRYQNLRSQQSDPTPNLVSNERQPQVAPSLSSATLTQSSRRKSKPEDGRVSPSHFDFSKDPAYGKDLSPDARVEDLDKENFDDVRCMLLETSLTAPTPNRRSTNRLSTSLTALNSRSRLSMSFCEHLAPSPLTDAVHSTEVSFARLDDSTINLLDLDDSILVPSSPAYQIGASVATGNLVDLS